MLLLRHGVSLVVVVPCFVVVAPWCGLGVVPLCCCLGCAGVIVVVVVSEARCVSCCCLGCAGVVVVVVVEFGRWCGVVAMVSR